MPFILLIALHSVQAPRSTAGARAPVVLTNVTVIDATGAPPKPGVTVVIANGRVQTIGRQAEAPAGAQRVDGTGKYLIPGLWDMHVHPDDPEIYPVNPPNDEKKYLLPLFVANGVTGVRDMGGDLDLLKSWRRSIQQGEWSGPRLVIGGPLVDGPKPMWPGSVAVGTPEQGVRAVDSLLQAGADFIKVYSLLPRTAYFAIARRARERGVTFAGHVPETVTVEEASDSGQKSEEHLLNVVRDMGNVDSARAAAGAATSPDRYARYAAMNDALLATWDGAKAARLFAKLARNGTYQTPTLINWRTNAWAGEPDPEWIEWQQYLPAYLRKWWSPAENVHLQDQSPVLTTTSRKLFAKYLDIVRQMDAAGVRMMAGTDMGGNPFCFPGWSLHQELELFVRAGLSPMKALQTATKNPADFLGISDSLGTIERGKIADLVLLDANPLENIRNTMRIRAVIVGGRFLGRAELDLHLAAIKEHVQR
ncbi:MAG: amidohydrolase family protein [Gemmatimonadota bacterium]